MVASAEAPIICPGSWRLNKKIPSTSPAISCKMGPLLVLNGVIKPINGWKSMGKWGCNQYKWSYVMGPYCLTGFWAHFAGKLVALDLIPAWISRAERFTPPWFDCSKVWGASVLNSWLVNLLMYPPQSSWKSAETPKGNEKVFQPSIFRGELLVLGRVRA